MTMDWIDDLGEAWRREYPGVDVSTLPPLVRLARLSLLIEAFQHQVLEPFDLTPSDYGVLAMLRRAGDPYQLSPSDLTNRLQRSSGGMTKILKRLTSGGLVERTPDPNDGRGSLVRITASGHAVQDRVFNAFITATQKLLAPVPAGKLRETDRSLKALLDVFESHFYV
jgi:DNA-binding MarR family transcriptional regulator